MPEMRKPDCNDPDDLLVGDLIIEACKQHPNIPAHVIHDAYLAKQLVVRSTGQIDFPYVTRNGRH